MEETPRTDEPRVGVYICDCGVNIAATVDTEAVTEYASKLPHVVIAKNYKYMCSDPGQNLIKDDIKEHNLNRIVVASCTPRMHEPTFRAAVIEAGLNPCLFEMANIREHCSWIHKETDSATEKAKKIVELSVARAPLLEPLSAAEVGVTREALVVGGGIAGVQAARDIADRGYPVHLVERELFLGGRTIWLSKIFPLRKCEEDCVGDCAPCFITPELKSAVNHPNIHVHLNSEVFELDGYVGNFEVKIRENPLFVDRRLCTLCGECTKVCPVSVPDDNDYGMRERKAIYRPSEAAIPATYVLDGKNCGYFTGGQCSGNPLCVGACKFGAINLGTKEETVEAEVGAIVVATGSDNYDPSEKRELMHDNPRVMSAPEFERISSHLGPTSGEILVNGGKPERVAFISCVGSREEGGNTYCSRVCCMYTAKEAHTVRKKLPDAKIAVYYTDVRTFGKGHDEFYVRVSNEDVEYRQRDLDHRLEVAENGRSVVVKCEGHDDFEADLVVLATGMIPRSDAVDVMRLFNISRSSDGFYLEAHPKLRPIDTFTDGVFLAGCCQFPKDITDTMFQASGAAARACGILSSPKLTLNEAVAFADETCTGCGQCVETCQFGAIALEEKDGELVAVVNDVLCKACGTCIAACPSGSMQQKHYTDKQILAMIEAMGGSSL
ncbi:MAG: CoB--CoM heterodisulfide reductase iron-sulfur subunit A family protein [Methanobacteriota archaeon]|nr:MAG: CoB--CoM heterodisulfide reductase iron-sulfur subunit A family protein [Euryarchaeota archaeon]